MANSRSKRKEHSDKFPLTLHPTGRYCKRIRGKLYYFGPDNNISGITGDLNGDGIVLEVHSPAGPAISALQEACMAEVQSL